MRDTTEARRAAYERMRRYPRPTEEGDGLCLCGCGQKAPIAKRDQARMGVFKGQPTHYLIGHQNRGRKRGEGRYVNSLGYVLKRMPDHPQAHKGYVLEHRWVMEQAMGRPLESAEHVHHRNGDKTDNRPENLELADRVAHGHKHGRPKGVPTSPEHRAKLSAAQTRVWAERRAQTGLAKYRTKFTTMGAAP